MDNVRICPLVEVSPYWERELSTYPDTIRVAMEDGTVVTYRRDIEQPMPESYFRVMEILKAMPIYGGHKTGNQEGYQCQYSPKHEKKKGRSNWDRICIRREKDRKGGRKHG